MQDIWSTLHSKFSHSPSGNAEESVEKTLARIKNDLSDAEQKQVISSDFTPKALRFASSLPFVRDLVAGYYCMSDSSTPAQIKASILIPLVYFVLPADAIPDIIPAAGFTDDLAVWVATLKVFGGHLNDQHYGAADALLKLDRQIEDQE
jgi:uncharacterized membrane protein YkvA (DUF1232 family)